MFLIYKLKSYDGENIYSENSLIGIYQAFDKAKQDLIKKLGKSKYEIEVDKSEYLFISTEKSNKLGGIICYEVKKYKKHINKI